MTFFLFAGPIVIPVPAGSFRVWQDILLHGLSFWVRRSIPVTNSWVALLCHLFGVDCFFTCVLWIKRLLLKSKEVSTSQSIPWAHSRSVPCIFYVGKQGSGNRRLAPGRQLPPATTLVQTDLDSNSCILITICPVSPIYKMPSVTNSWTVMTGKGITGSKHSTVFPIIA